MTGGREEGRKGGRDEEMKGGREKGRKGGREEGRKGGRKIRVGSNTLDTWRGRRSFKRVRGTPRTLLDLPRHFKKNIKISKCVLTKVAPKDF